MDSLTAVFPGQGSQYPGMARDFYDRYPVSRRTFEEASAALGEDLIQISFQNDPRLNLTEFTQPCILTAEIAMYRAIVEKHGIEPRYFAGHSLGEYAALVAANVMPLDVAVRATRRRGALMQAAVPVGQGAMAALLMDDIETSGVVELIRERGVEIANRNSPHQLVISGAKDAVNALMDQLDERFEELTVVPLNVSAPFHSGLMRGIESEFEETLRKVEHQLNADNASRVYSNYTGELHDPALLITNLVRQISGTVQWTRNMNGIARDSTTILEIGPGCPLQKFFAKIGATVNAIPDVAALQANAALLESLRRPVPAREFAGVGAPSSGATFAPISAPPRLTVPQTPHAMSPERVAQTPSNHPSSVEPKQKIRAETLGDRAFREDHGLKYAYVVGAMVHGISSEEMVIRMGRAGLLAYYGTGGLSLQRVEAAIVKIQNELRNGEPWGMNLLSNLNQPEMEDQTIDMYLKHGVRRVEASAYTLITPALVRYRLSGVTENSDGTLSVPNKVMAKLSRPEVAQVFLSPAPERIVKLLQERGQISADEARLAARIPMADDICAESDSGGHTDKGVMSALLPAILVMRDAAMKEFQFSRRIRVGAAGGLGTPAAIAAAFVMGADFVLTGSVNQCTVEAATSDTVKDMLAAADIQDFAMAPAGDMFEIGARVQVFRRGTFFPVRANKLYELYVRCDSLEAIDAPTRELIERDYFKKSFEQVWQETQEYYRSRGDTAQLDKAARSPKHKMALVFRWYFGRTMRLSYTGDPNESIDYQVHSGPALGSFNRWFKGGPLENWRDRHVDDVATALMRGAADVLNDQFARFMSQGETR